MKGRVTALVLALALVFSLVVPGIGVRSAAAESAYFTAVNENLCLLNDDTMPFWSGGTLYVHSSVFSSYDLNISYVKDSAAKAVLLYSGGKLIEFDISAGTANNGLGTYYSVTAKQKGGVVYLPVAFVCNYFGLTYSILDTDWVPLVRVCSASAVLSDRQFVDAASSLMAARYNAYVQSKKTPVTPPQKDEKADTTTPAAPQEPSGDDDTAETVPSHASVRVLLAVRVVAGADVSGMLDTLDGYGYQAAFFLDSAALEEQTDLLRRILASGHRVGLILPEGGNVAVLEQGNEILRQHTGTVTRLALAGQSGAAEAAGYAVYAPTVLAENLGSTASSRAAKVMRALPAKNGTARLLLGSDAVSASALRTLCAQLHSDNYTVQPVTEVNCG